MNRIKKMFFIVWTLLLTGPALFSETAQQTAEHAKEVSPSFFQVLLSPRISKFVIMLILGIVALVLLKTKKMNKGIKISMLSLTFILFGLLGNWTAPYFVMHPSPICAATKSILYGFGTIFVITLGVIFFLSLLRPKRFCGWVCPVGAIQELISMLSDKLGIRRRKTNFTAAHTIRVIIFLLFIFLSATAVIHQIYEGEKYAQSLYDYINPFHGLEFGWNADMLENIIHYLPLLLTIGVAFLLYRPFCHFVCPIGLYTHWLDQIAIFKVRFKKDSCTNCTICTDKTPCSAIPEILKEAKLRPDCFACGECIDKCPKGSFKIGCK